MNIATLFGAVDLASTFTGPVVIISVYVVLIAAFFEYFDSAAGMGYGTSLTPLLFALGYEPLQVVPCILISELITGAVAAFVHNEYGNVHFNFKRGELSRDARVMLVAGGLGVVATAIGVFVAINLPKTVVKTYVAVLILLMAVIMLFTIKKEYSFSWKRIGGFSFIAGFNKAIGGGGYGPVIVVGQLLSGVSVKAAVGIVSLAESMVCLVGALCYILYTAVRAGETIDWVLLPSMVLGAIIASLAAPYTVKVMPAKILKAIVIIYAFVVGAICLWQIFG